MPADAAMEDVQAAPARSASGLGGILGGVETMALVLVQHHLWY